VREGNTARYLRGHTSMCSQQDGRCELGFQKRIVLPTILAWASRLGEHRRSLATDHLVGMQ